MMLAVAILLAAAEPAGMAAPCPFVGNVQALETLGLLGATINRPEPDIDPHGPAGQLYPEERLLLKHGRLLWRRPGFVWDWFFWEGRGQIVADVGPLHFSEEYELIDLKNGKVSDWFGLPQDAGRKCRSGSKQCSRDTR